MRRSSTRCAVAVWPSVAVRARPQFLTSRCDMFDHGGGFANPHASVRPQGVRWFETRLRSHLASLSLSSSLFGGLARLLVCAVHRKWPGGVSARGAAQCSRDGRGFLGQSLGATGRGIWRGGMTSVRWSRSRQGRAGLRAATSGAAVVISVPAATRKRPLRPDGGRPDRGELSPAAPEPNQAHPIPVRGLSRRNGRETSCRDGEVPALVLHADAGSHHPGTTNLLSGAIGYL